MLKMDASPNAKLKAVAKRISKQYKKNQLKKLKAKEYKRLKAVLPALTHKDRVSKVMLIEEAIKYIDELHQTLLNSINRDENYTDVTKDNVINTSQQLFIQLQQSQETPVDDVTRWQGTSHQISNPSSVLSPIRCYR